MKTPLTSATDLYVRYESVTTAIVNDVLRARGLLDQTLPHGIRPLTEGLRVAGPAFTIEGRKDRDPANDMPERAAMLESIDAGTICVWATAGDDESAQWGEIMTMAAKRQGCRGAIIDGGVRDTDRVRELGFPIFHRYFSSNGMMGRFRITAWQQEIVIGGVRVSPGDVVFADMDGVIIVPRQIADEVLVAAEEIRDNEVDIKQMVSGGMAPREVVARGGYF